MIYDRNVRITALLPGRPSLTLKLIGQEKFGSGAGGWQEVARKLREPILVWTERPLRTLELPLRFDRYMATYEETVDGDARSLEDWASSGYRADREHNPPTLVRVSGNVRSFATPMSASTKWVVTALAWGEFITGKSGERVQQDVTATLTEYASVTPAGYAAALREALGEDDPT